MKNINSIAAVVLSGILIMSQAFGCFAGEAGTRKLEKYYQEKYCIGDVEVPLMDGTRCDCVTEWTAGEFDFAKKMG